LSVIERKPTKLQKREKNFSSRHGPGFKNEINLLAQQVKTQKLEQKLQLLKENNNKPIWKRGKNKDEKLRQKQLEKRKIAMEKRDKRL